jgi:hypothetical protein
MQQTTNCIFARPVGQIKLVAIAIGFHFMDSLCITFASSSYFSSSHRDALISCADALIQFALSSWT